jgi:hypothetical protein
MVHLPQNFDMKASLPRPHESSQLLTIAAGEFEADAYTFEVPTLNTPILYLHPVINLTTYGVCM